MEEDMVLGFEDGRLWLPAHIIGEACDSKVYSRPQRHRLLPDSLLENPLPPYHQPFSKPRWKPHHKPRFQANRMSGGPGMQAIFLDSGQRSCGTGVFLPRNGGNDSQTSKKPGCSPVLLPSRIVQALNLNVHALGSPLMPQREPRDEHKSKIRDFIQNKTGDEEQDSDSPLCCVFSKSRSSSPEIFLPKEWSY
ncbi:uncharacterized protein LOC143853090 [Tasmannia lanceolata]|uniref:uncharacterized protein LOC143853090 n=1 Tax=Tasmannia lanceolata TaxID=3420 RepID=UPI0040629CBA